MKKTVHLAMSLYLPVFLFSFSRGMTLPVIPLFAKSLEAGLGGTGIIVAMFGLGALLMDLPAGFLIGKLGSTPSMAVGLAGMAGSALGMAYSPSPFFLGFFYFLSGVFLALWNIARLSYMKTVLPVNQRGRALSLMGGTLRIGTFAGPIAGGIIAKLSGYPAVFVVQMVLLLVSMGITVLFLPWRIPSKNDDFGRKQIGIISSIRDLISSHGRIFLTAGGAMIALQFLRASRQLIYPLWADSIGLDVVLTGIVMGTSTGIELALFVPTGFIMDRKGRKWAAVPCISILALSFLLLPLTSGFWTMLAVGLAAGFGNGLGAGINMTFGSDLAPDREPEKFLSMWHFITDGGRTLAPVVVGTIASVITLMWASVLVAVVGGIGAAGMAFLVTEPLKE